MRVSILTTGTLLAAAFAAAQSGSIQASKFLDDQAQCQSLLINSGACAGLGTAGATNPVALGAAVFDPLGKSAVCGRTITLTNPANGKTTTATVTDRAAANIVDMCNVNWAALGGDVANDAQFPITYSL